MLKISHIKIVCIIIGFTLFGMVFKACYMPRGAFVASLSDKGYRSNDSIFIALPVDFQKYNYFKVTYVKNKQVYIASKVSDSSIVFVPIFQEKVATDSLLRIEAGILPFR